MARRSPLVPLLGGLAAVVLVGLAVWQLDLLSLAAPDEPTGLDGAELVAAPEARPDRGSPLAPAETSRDVDIPTPPSISRGVIDLGPRRGRVDGRLVDEYRRPVPDASIGLLEGVRVAGLDLLEDHRRLVRERATTDADGRFSFSDVPTTEQLLVDVDGDDVAPTLAGPFVVRPDATTDVGSIVTAPGVVVAGRVRDRGDRPVGGARVGLHHGLPSVASDGSVSRPVRLVVTDEDGRFEIGGLGRTSGALYVEADGFAAQYKPFGATSDDLRRIDVSVTLEPPAPIRGRVVSKPEGKPIEGAMVEAIPVNQATAGLGAATTGPDGRFALDGLAPGTYTLRASHDGHSRETKQGVRGGTEDVLIGLKRRGTMHGVVRTDDGAPVTGFDLRARYAPRKTEFASGLGTSRRVQDPDGEFSLVGLDPGFYTLEAWAPGYALTLSEPIRIKQGQDLYGVKLELVPAATIVGRVVDDEDRPIRGVAVSLHPNREPSDALLRGSVGDQAWLLSTTTDADGRFVLDPVTEMSYQVQFDQADHSLVRVDDVAAEAGEATDMGTIVLMRSGTLRGVVLDGGGQPVPSITVHLSARDAPTSRRTTTNSQGEFVFDRLPGGDYEARAFSKSLGLGGHLRDVVRRARATAEAAKTQGAVPAREWVNVQDGQTQHVTVTLVETN